MKLGIDKYGYQFVKLNHKRKKYHRLIHRLVAIAFIPNPENKSQVNHIDGYKLNNKVKNLEWSTPAENIMHACMNNLRYSDITNVINHNEDNIIKVCEMLELKTPISVIHDETNVSLNTIKDIKRRRSWKYISKLYNW
jgi:HNH endonuclease.